MPAEASASPVVSVAQAALPTTSSNSPSVVSLPHIPPEIESLKLPVPKDVEFVARDKWEAQEPYLSILEDREHPQNAPIMDIVVMHAVVLTTAENELSKLQQIQQFHMEKSGRGYGDIAPHYLIGPSGKVYEGRDLRFAPEKTVGEGMGRFAHAWGKCAIMLLGNFNLPEQEFTSAAKSALRTLIDDRRLVFEEKYRDALILRESDTKALQGPQNQGPFGLDQVRVRKHPTIPPILQSFLDGDSEVNKPDGGSSADAGLVVPEGGNINTAGDGGTTP